MHFRRLHPLYCLLTHWWTSMVHFDQHSRRHFAPHWMPPFRGIQPWSSSSTERRDNSTSVNFVHNCICLHKWHELSGTYCTHRWLIHLHRPTTSSAAAQQFSFQCTCGLQSQRAKKQTWTCLSHHSAICEGYTLLASQNVPPSCPLHRMASAQYSMRRAKKYSEYGCGSATQLHILMIHILASIRYLIMDMHVHYMQVYLCVLDSSTSLCTMCLRLTPWGTSYPERTRSCFSTRALKGAAG